MRNVSEIISYHTITDNILEDVPQYSISLLVILMQIVFASWILKQGLQKNSLFFLTFSLTAIIQRIVLLSKIPMMSLFEYQKLTWTRSSLEPVWYKFSIYVDFVSYFFYLTAITAMILNAKLTGKYTLHLLVGCILISLIASLLSIELSGVTRTYFDEADLRGKNSLVEKNISRLCMVLSIVGVWFYHHKNIPKQAKIVFGILCVALFYIVQHFLNEIAALLDYSSPQFYTSGKTAPLSHRFCNLYISNFENLGSIPLLFLPIFLMLTKEK